MVQKISFPLFSLAVFLFVGVLPSCSPLVEEASRSPASTQAPAKIITTAVGEPAAQTPASAASASLPLPSATPLPTSAEANGTSEICSPLAGLSPGDLPALITNPFNPPRMGVDDFHMGVDFAIQESGLAVSGTTLHSVLQGRVALILEDRFPYGNALMIETPLDNLSEQLLAHLALPTPSPTIEPHSALNCPDVPPAPFLNPEKRSIYILYAHLAGEPRFELEEIVKCGDEIGSVGDSGNALNPHLHLEVRTGSSGARLGSMSHYSTSASPGEMNAYCTWRIREIFQLIDPMKLFIDQADIK